MHDPQQYTPVGTSSQQYTPVGTSSQQYTPVGTSSQQYTPGGTSSQLLLIRTKGVPGLAVRNDQGNSNRTDIKEI